MFILYRVGGGSASNVAKGAINRISYLNADFRNGQTVDDIINTLTVTNTTPSISGKDMPSEKEIKYLIKYNNSSQERCVTVKDYIDRLLMLPPKYGTPFRVGVSEESNKIMIYLLGIDNEGTLTTALPITLIKNIEDYLSSDVVEEYPNSKWIYYAKAIELISDTDITSENYNDTEEYKNVIRYFGSAKSKILGKTLDTTVDPEFKDFSTYTPDEKWAISDLAYNGIIENKKSDLNGNDKLTKSKLNRIVIEFALKYNLIT